MTNHQDDSSGDLVSREAFPTEEQIADACLSRRHDFGLLNGTERRVEMDDALEWLRAWRRAYRDSNQAEGAR